MTYSSHTKVFKQLEVKPAKLQKFIKHNTPKKRDFGRNVKRCGICDRSGAHIQKYGINLCRQCFRENAKKIGFRKYN
ncbi:30S ribosomal protein S14 [Candidatus Woesearchaeota archaeon]|nr:30S ribosomal protein S14 [Candidatus Woesearchaeota archaeon]